MARIRTIKPSFFTSADVCDLSPLARLLYIATWCEADREGRLVWNLRTLKLRYLPADDCDIEQVAEELVRAGLVRVYEVDGCSYAVIPTFSSHQHVNPREAKSTLPPPPEPDASARVGHASSRVTDASLRVTDAQVGKEGKGRERKDPPRTPPLAQGGGAATKATRTRAEPPPELNVLADEIERHTGIRYPPSAFEGLRERLREHSLEDLLAYVRWAARDDWLRTTVQLKPSVLLRKARCAEGVAAARAAPLIPMRRPFGGLPPEPPPPALPPGTQLPVLCDRCGERIPSTWDGERWLIPDHEWDGAPCVAPEIERRAAAGAEECV